jgi:hypothetical protein
MIGCVSVSGPGTWMVPWLTGILFCQAGWLIPRRLDAGRCNSACHPLPVTRYPGGRNTGSAGTFTPAADSCLHPAGSLAGSGFDPDLAIRAGQSPSHPLLAAPRILLKGRVFTLERFRIFPYIL